MTQTSLSPAAPAWPRRARVTAAAVTAVAVAAIVAYLVAIGHPELALGLLLAVPAAQIAVRYPLSAVLIWLLVAPFVVETTGGGLRMVYWVVHRALPPAAVLNVVIAAALGARPRLPRLTWAEAAMAGYLLITQLSILYTSAGVMASTFHLYDRVFAPMCLYLLVRFVQPDERHVRRIVPLVVFILLSQTLIGALQWTVPGALPGAWLDRIGLRTTGSLRHPNVYGTTMLFAALVLLHVGMVERHRLAGRAKLWLVPLAFVMVFMTYSRASWLAATIVVLGAFTIYPRYITRMTIVVSIVGVALLLSGTVDLQIEMARRRFLSESSEESALSRLPVMAASVRMFQRQPVIGWGYENFDRYDRQFQVSVGDLVVPEKDHASHNLYLTLLAEQGLPGLLLYLAPFFYWLARSRTAWRTMPVEGVFSRKLLVCLWLMLLSHVVINNYANMRVVWGLGLWWVTLGMIASLVVRYHPVAIAEAASGEARTRRRDTDATTTGAVAP